MVALIDDDRIGNDEFLVHISVCDKYGKRRHIAGIFLNCSCALFLFNKMVLKVAIVSAVMIRFVIGKPSVY